MPARVLKFHYLPWRTATDEEVRECNVLYGALVARIAAEIEFINEDGARRLESDYELAIIDSPESDKSALGLRWRVQEAAARICQRLARGGVKFSHGELDAELEKVQGMKARKKVS